MTKMDTPRAASPLTRPSRLRMALLGGLAVTVLALSGCGGDNTDARPYEKNSDGQWTRGGEGGSGGVFGKSGLNVLGGGNNADQDNSGSGSGNGVNVNAYLWRASLDTLSFMPLSSADPFGGVIITDWYSTPETPQERFKVNVFILGRALRSDGVKVSVFRQAVDPSSGRWTDTPVGASVATEMENAILTRARQMRVAVSK